ncbi:MAG: elongation factor P [Spirochaetaceae bacterium]|nr:MAG: elongation factor P [Spirochaetaceae bacterium]
MIKGGAIEKGMYILFKGDPYLVAEREFVNPGKGAAFTRCKLKNAKTGAVLKETIKTSDNVEVADVYDRDGQYLYTDEAAHHFMDVETYEQFEISQDVLADTAKYLKEGDQYRIIMWEADPIDVIIPMKMVYTVTDAPDAVKGDTVTGATKTVVVETGLSVQVPIFIKTGDKIRVNTESGDYVERVND